LISFGFFDGLEKLFSPESEKGILSKEHQRKIKETQNTHLPDKEEPPSKACVSSLVSEMN